MRSLRKLRLKYNLTQVYVASLFGMWQAEYSKLETGARKFGPGGKTEIDCINVLYRALVQSGMQVPPLSFLGLQLPYEKLTDEQIENLQRQTA